MKYNSDEIKARLLEEEYPNNPVILGSVTSQILSLKGEGEKAFVEWFESNNVPNFDIEGITPSYLRKYHGMKDVAIILVYARLIEEPKAAFLLKKPVIKH